MPALLGGADAEACGALPEAEEELEESELLGEADKELLEDMLTAAVLNICKILLTVCTLTWVMFVHSVLSLPLLLAVFAMSLLEYRRAFACAGYVLLYAALFLCAQFVYDSVHPLIQEDGLANGTSVLQDIGLRPFDQYGAKLALQCLAAAPLSLAARVGRDDLGRGFMPVLPALARIIVALVRPAEAASSDAEQAGACGQLRRGLRTVWLLVLSLLRSVVANLDKVVLLLLFVAAISPIDPDLLHSGYIAFCLVFGLIPWLSKKGWAALLLYCELVLFMLYIWQFSWIGQSASAGAFAELVGLDFDGNCTAVGAPNDVFGDAFIVNCWESVGLPACVVVMVSLQLAIFRGTAMIGAAEPYLSADATDQLADTVSGMQDRVFGFGAWVCDRCGHYLIPLILIAMTSVGPSSGMRGIFLFVACIVLMVTQLGRLRRLGSGVRLLVNLSMLLLGIIILVKYVYKFPQVRTLVEDGAVNRTVLEDIGLTHTENRYLDLLPDTIALTAVTIVVRCSREYRRRERRKHGEGAEAAAAGQEESALTALWGWLTASGDLIAVGLLFVVAVSRLSVVSSFYFVMGIFVSCLGRLPGLLWALMYTVATLHMLVVYVLRFQSFGSEFLCEEEAGWKCCAIWFGLEERYGDDIRNWTWELLPPLVVMFALDIHRRFHYSAAALQPPQEVAGDSGDGRTSFARITIGGVSWLRRNATLQKFGLEGCYIVLMVATVVNHNVMSLVYTLLLCACVVSDNRSPRLWLGFACLFGLLLAARYFVYLGLPPCQSARLPTRQLANEWRIWLGLANTCVTNSDVFESCRVPEFLGDGAVLFLTAAFSRVSKHQEGEAAAKQLDGYGIDWASHLHFLLWDCGLTTALSVFLVLLAYTKFNMFTLGYVWFGLRLLHQRKKLTAQSPAIRHTMIYSGFVLLAVGVWQCPALDAGSGICTDADGLEIPAANSTSCLSVEGSWQLEETSFQSVIGLRKYSDRTTDLWLAAIVFWIALALRGVVRSGVYQQVLQMEENELEVEAPARHREFLKQQERALEQSARQASEAQTALEHERQRLHAEHGKSRTSDMLSMPKPEPEPEPEPESPLDESLDAGLASVTSPPPETGSWVERLVDWLYSHADTLIHDRPDLELGASTAEGDVEASTSTSARVAEAFSKHSLVLVRVAWYFLYAHTQQLCCAMVSLGFIAHRDVLSAGLFLSMFGLILISSRSITIAWWRWAIWTMEFRIVLVKFIQAWPTDRLFAAGPDSEGIDLTPYQRVLHLGSPGWDVVLLLALILHRQHLLRRGEWIDRKAGAEMSQQRIDELREILSGASLTPAKQSSGSERAVRLGADTYTPMFAAQMALFFSSVLLYSDISGEQVSELSQQVDGGQLPWQLIALLLVIFMLLLLDRAVYLYRSLRAKLVVQWVSVLLFVAAFIWLTVDSTSGPSTAQSLFAALASIYFYQSAVQVAKGYASIQDVRGGKFLTRKTDLRSSVLSGLRAVPFFLELCFLIEWFCTYAPPPPALYCSA